MVSVGAAGRVTAIVIVLLAACWLASVTVNVGVLVPGAEGVPLIVPFENVSPAGRVPELKAKV
jgi:hypothetical protein